MRDKTAKTDKMAIFDLGNVLINWDVEGIVGAMGQNEIISTTIKNELFYHQDWLDIDHGLKSEAQVINDVCSRTELSKDLVASAFEAAKESMIPIPATVKLMEEFFSKGIEMYCLSNMGVETYHHIKGYPFFDLFKGIVISGIERCMKPDHQIYQLLLGRFGLKPAQAFFIDDTAANIKAANELGIGGLVFDRSAKSYSAIKQEFGLL
jgi:putative hydrolase of the HAD superfamily